MNSTIRLRGMAWDHPRAINPLKAISAEYSRQRNIAVEWDARPLKDFEDQPLEELATIYDLVLIDYPFVGFAATSGLIVPVNEWTDADYLADQAANSVGPSYASYTWQGKQWALAIDSATQVMAVRDELWDRIGQGELPSTWEDAAVLAKRLGNATGRVAVALKPNHAYCAFLAVGITLVGDDFWPEGGHVDQSAALEALEFLRNLSTHLHPISGEADPIAVSDHMSSTDEIVYVPLMFGYSSYSREGFRPHCLRFGNAPTGRSGRIGSILGGVGIALSARSQYPETAADLARHLVAPEIQAGIYVDSGGQPGHAAAWESAAANAQVKDFFTATRNSMEQAFVRPRVPGHRLFQELAGELVHKYIWSREIDSAAQCLSSYNDLVDSLLGDWSREDVHPDTAAAMKNTTA
jgi:multiple sugar transport system substrate-binding protein